MTGDNNVSEEITTTL